MDTPWEYLSTPIRHCLSRKASAREQRANDGVAGLQRQTPTRGVLSYYRVRRGRTALLSPHSTTVTCRGPGRRRFTGHVAHAAGGAGAAGSRESVRRSTDSGRSAANPDLLADARTRHPPARG